MNVKNIFLLTIILATFSMSNVSFSMKIEKTDFGVKEENKEIKIEIKKEKKKKVKNYEDIVSTSFKLNAIKKRNRLLRDNKILGALCWPCLPCLSCFPWLLCCK